MYILDQFISSIESRFEQFLEYENMFGFLFNSNKFKTLSKDELMTLEIANYFLPFGIFFHDDKFLPKLYLDGLDG